MYIEDKSTGLSGPARIGRVRFSKSGKSVFYAGMELRTLKGYGFKANFEDVVSGKQYWISGPRKDGTDRLYGERISVEIDEDVRAEYWKTIRGMPEQSKNAAT